MKKSEIQMSKLYDYIASVSLREHRALQDLREKTAEHPDAIMQIPPEQGQFMALRVKLIGKKLKIGTRIQYTGYSNRFNIMSDIQRDRKEKKKVFISGYKNFTVKRAGVLTRSCPKLGARLEVNNDLAPLFPYINSSVDGLDISILLNGFSSFLRVFNVLCILMKLSQPL